MALNKLIHATSLTALPPASATALPSERLGMRRPEPTLQVFHRGKRSAQTLERHPAKADSLVQVIDLIEYFGA
jgi:hypothetical protein